MASFNDGTSGRAERVRRSPTGRVPQWVVDEALGQQPMHAVPWRAAPPLHLGSPRPPRPPSRRKHWGVRALMVAAVIGAFVVASYWGPSHWPGAFSPAQASRSVNAPTPGKEEAARPLGAPAPVALASSSYRFVSTNSTTPVAYNPCRPIHYVTRLQGAPASGAAMISEAIAQVSAATGLHFVDDGATAEPASRDRRAYQPELYGDRWAPVLIVWTSAAENPDFVGDLAGQAGSAPASTRDGTRVYVSGQVELDGEKLARIAVRPNGRSDAQAIIQHELGHLVGLDHVGDATQLMFGTNSGAVTNYAAGDLSGLAMLGRGTCAPDL